MAYGDGLENRCPSLKDRGFESRPLRQPAPGLRLVSQLLLYPYPVQLRQTHRVEFVAFYIGLY